MPARVLRRRGKVVRSDFNLSARPEGLRRRASPAFQATLAAVACVTSCAPAVLQAQDAAQATDAPALEEVVVTAQRREESLQRAAISVSAVDADTLRRASVTTAADLSVVVPSLQGATQAGYPVFFIRGVGSRALNPYSEPAVAFNLNGVYVARPNAINGQFFDVDRGEVLKGPQGTLYGRNATGGAIN